MPNRQASWQIVRDLQV
ncbi:MAG: hypothetical protein Q4A06_04470 [Cardiobacteriaceae bacterium]|nr:hypothetical protein [Cardiobacteriaceae bacterium]